MAILGKQFTTAKRIACKASIMIQGLSGKGKSGTALLIAKALASSPDKIFAIDAENDSLQLFADIKASDGTVFKDFKIVSLTAEDGYKPTNYLELRDLAVKLGAEVVIKDSISHAWQYEGGILSMVSKVAADSKKKDDKYAPWRDADVVKEKNNLLELLRCNKCHVITTVRVKEKTAPETEIGKDGNPHTVIKSLGEQQIMQDDIKYEPDLVLDMLSPGRVTSDGTITHPRVKVIKSRYVIFAVDEEYTLTPDLLKQLKEYLSEGVDPEVLLEKQRQDLITAVTDYLTTNSTKQAVWKILKKDMGYDATPINQLPLSAIKSIFARLTV